MKKETNLNAGISEPEKVDAFMKTLKHPMADVAQYVRECILSAGKNVGEGIYWNGPTFYFTGKMKPFDPKEYKRYIVGFNFYKPDCIRLIFLTGAKLKNITGILEGDYKDGRRLLLIHSMSDAKLKEKALKALVKEWIKLVDT